MAPEPYEVPTGGIVVTVVTVVLFGLLLLRIFTGKGKEERTGMSDTRPSQELVPERVATREALLHYIVTTALNFGLDRERGNTVFVPRHGETLAYVEHGVNTQPGKHGNGWLVRYFLGFRDGRRTPILKIATVGAQDDLRGISRGRYKSYR